MIFPAELIAPPNIPKDQVTNDNLIVKISLRESIDLYNSMELYMFLKAMITGNLKKILLDVAKLDYIDSSGIGAFIKITKIVRGAKGDIVLINVSDKVNKVFSLVKLQRLIGIYPTEKEAISHLRMK